MKVSLQDNFAVRDKVEKVRKAGRREGLKLIHGWVKAGNIDFGVFAELVKHVKQEGDSERKT